MNNKIKQNQKAFDDHIKEISRLVSSVKYGSISIIIQDGVIVQIEKNEKIRFSNN